MREHGLFWPPLPLTKNKNEGQCCSSGVDMDGGATGEVEHAPLSHPAAVHPERDRAVDEDRPNRHEHGPGRELHAVGNGAGDQGRRYDRERHEKYRRDDVVRRLDVLHPYLIERADESTVAGIGKRVTDQHPTDRDCSQAIHVHHEHVEHVLGPEHAAIEQRQPRHHEEHHRCSRNHPRDVACLHRLRSPLGTSGTRSRSGRS